ncbi:MAG: FAD-dependent oxidoreductase [Fimbriimonadaceae bacterium]|nr:FAD-dependent oxidoreductase [Fimbriimonadaceae bacterium]QYK56871.1 MAG: FAD-dependent oxidoreductase [Fimbriimonadaceae bacterium]
MSTDRDPVAFPTLSEAQIAQIAQFSEPKTFADGEYLFQAGVAGFSFFLIQEGAVEIVEDSDVRRRRVVVHGPGEFTGDVDMITGRPPVVSAVAQGKTTVLEVCPERLKKIVSELPVLSDLILRAFIQRRALLLEGPFVGIRVIGSRFNRETLRIREFLARNDVPYTWTDVESDRDVQTLLDRFNLCVADTPVVILLDGTILKSPSTVEIAHHLGLSQSVNRSLYDLIVIGSGPAGLAAAVYGASEGLRTLVIDSSGPGGQAGASSRIENYMGFPTGLSGADLAHRAIIQAQRFGASFLTPGDVTQLSCRNQTAHNIHLSDGRVIAARCIIIATGASYRKLELPELPKFEGQGVYYAATQVEAVLCNEKPVAVVGAGNSAGQAAVFLSDRSEKVYLVVRGDDLRKSMSSYLADRIENTPNIELVCDSEIVELCGDSMLERVKIANRCTKDVMDVSLSGLFVMIGADPCTDWLASGLGLDSKGFILTGPAAKESGAWRLLRDPFLLETTCPGVFAAGDVRSGSVKRVSSAVGEGSMAVSFAHQFLATR